MKAEPAARRGPNFSILISLVLLVGVSLAAVILAVGLVIFFAHGGANEPASSMFSATPHSLLGVVRRAMSGALQGDPQALLGLGVLVLLATPVLRVAASIVLFLAEKDWLYSVLTLVVLGILLYSIFFIH
ncbi:MAG: DUF1634 domain-containing protein [Chloroflexota bacterium]